MSYGPIWYEWSKRPVKDSDTADFIGEGNTHTRHGVGETLVTELFWCQPALYRGAPGFTNTKYRQLIATIYCVPYHTNDEGSNRVYVKSHGFMESACLQKAVDYALDDKQTEPGTNCARLAAGTEYVVGQDYPCSLCGRTAVKVCKDYYDPLCVNKDGVQNSIANAMNEFDNSCHSTCTVIAVDKDLMKWSPMTAHCYTQGPHTEHKVPFSPENWKQDSAWNTPTTEKRAEMRAKLLAERTAYVEKFVAKGLSDG